MRNATRYNSWAAAIAARRFAISATAGSRTTPPTMRPHATVSRGMSRSTATMPTATPHRRHCCTCLRRCARRHRGYASSAIFKPTSPPPDDVAAPVRELTYNAPDARTCRTRRPSSTPTKTGDRDHGHHQPQPRDHHRARSERSACVVHGEAGLLKTSRRRRQHARLSLAHRRPHTTAGIGDRVVSGTRRTRALVGRPGHVVGARDRRLSYHLQGTRNPRRHHSESTRSDALGRLGHHPRPLRESIQPARSPPRLIRIPGEDLAVLACLTSQKPKYTPTPVYRRRSR